ncbi:MAG: hypothetical protein IKS60_08680 [Lachnospiraceae bacterium]|nr:hypothetical protein [Lachnospiraceae bacterium]MBR4413679.1 hypothetical protein [Lachnospiraceae bacterium]MBR5917278.1 hypothetical protein [Lachnospiraceae bacterium]
MFACKNCGGNIIYDIKSQKLVCKKCSSSFAPESVTKENDSVDYDYFETTVFTCPQCGAEIMCEDNEAASFCTYCASSTVLTSRISKEKKPDYIIPFEKTKEECVDEFKKITKRAIFAPSELKDPKVLDQFKAIYVPYWFYEVNQEGLFKVSGAEIQRDVEYSHTYYFDVNGYINGKFEGICRDASYSFSDDLGERIAPFFTEGKKKFYPSYLSGFYADISDVPSKVYEHEAEELANDVAREVVSQESCRDDYKNMKIYLSNDEATKQFNTAVSAKRALFPIWFMSFKNEKKVAYMTVNGQTGKAASDFPISKRKFIIGTILLTLLFFPPALLILSVFKERTAFFALDIALILSAAAYIVYYVQIKILQLKDSGSEDAGRFYQKTQVVYIKNKDKNELLKEYIKKSILDIVMALVYVGMMLWEIPFILNVASQGKYFGLGAMSGALKIVLIIGNLILAVIGFIRAGKLKNSAKYYGVLLGGVLMVIVLGIELINAQSVILSIISSILLCAGGFLAIFDLVLYHNELSTRKPAHLKRRGGDAIAEDINTFDM